MLQNFSLSEISRLILVLPLDIVSTSPTPVAFYEPIPCSMKNNIINDLYGKTLHTFNYQKVIKTCDEVQRKDAFKGHFDNKSDFFTFFGSLHSMEIFFKEIKYVLRFFNIPEQNSNNSS